MFLALGLNNWADDRREARRLAEMRTYLIQEIRLNRDTLKTDYWLPHHVRLRDGLWSVVNMENPGPDDYRGALDQLLESGIHSGGTRDSVWQALQASGLLTQMPPEELLLVSDIYRGQASLEEIERAMAAGAGPLLQSVDTGQGARAALTTVAIYLGDVVSMEETLIQRYDSALAVMDPQGEPATTRTGDAAPPTG